MNRLFIDIDEILDKNEVDIIDVHGVVDMRESKTEMKQVFGADKWMMEDINLCHSTGTPHQANIVGGPYRLCPGANWARMFQDKFNASKINFGTLQVNFGISRLWNTYKYAHTEHLTVHGYQFLSLQSFVAMMQTGTYLSSFWLMETWS